MNIESRLSSEELDVWNNLLRTAPLDGVHALHEYADTQPTEVSIDMNRIDTILDSNDRRIDELQRKLDDLTFKLQALINMLPDNDINVEELL